MATGVDAGHDENEDTYGVLQFDYTDAGSGGGRYIGSFNAGDHLAYSPVNLVNITGVRTHARGDGTLSLRFGAVDAPAFATIVVDSGAWSIVNTTFASVPTGTGAIVVSYPAKPRERLATRCVDGRRSRPRLWSCPMAALTLRRCARGSPPPN